MIVAIFIAMRSFQRGLASISSRSFSLLRSQRAVPVQMQHFLTPHRQITERSFAAEELQKQGVKLDPAPEEAPLEVTDDMVFHPNERVQRLLDEFLDLNVLEVGMFMKAIQVN